MGDMADFVNEESPWDGMGARDECPFCHVGLEEIHRTGYGQHVGTSTPKLKRWTAQCPRCRLLFMDDDRPATTAHPKE